MTLQVWDIGGQTLGGKMLDKYVYGAHVRWRVHKQKQNPLLLQSQSFICATLWDSFNMRQKDVLLSPAASGRADHRKHNMKHWWESVSSSLIISVLAYCYNLSGFIQALPLPSSVGPIIINCQWVSQVRSTCLYFVKADDTDALCQTEQKMRLHLSSQLNFKANQTSSMKSETWRSSG